ncbi:Uncharacterized protein KIAA0564-like [Papilio machaon]|uniref:Uncharacterized protein KIAA0564-like n=1 Tax=Papilio machaon TaxID=76193 RepID=A0A0N0PEJ1_PAPMA|nr:Uncharacterized protein KIAA0564-like [Papilio machaon]
MYNPASTVRRIDVLIRILGGRKKFLQVNYVRAYSSEGKVTIGDVTKDITTPKKIEYVPRKYISVEGSELKYLSQSTLRNLRWMMQKDSLGQDMFLLGRPGPNSTLFQSAVRAAIEGRILVIEGIEKAERNVLPVLNNLLENREMHLEDGRFLVPAARYDKLLQEHGAEEVSRWRLVRVDENFRVIALGLPVPRYQGQPLDPPLRSRFQARDVATVGFGEHGAEEVSRWRLVRVDENFRVIALGLPVPRYQGQPLDPPLRSRFQARDVATVGFGVRIIDYIFFI